MKFSSLWFVFTAKCVDITRVLSDDCDGRATPDELAAARLHLMSCASCRRFRTQITFLERVIACMPVAQRRFIARQQRRVRMSPEFAERLRTVVGSAWCEQCESDTL